MVFVCSFPWYSLPTLFFIYLSYSYFYYLFLSEYKFWFIVDLVQCKCKLFRTHFQWYWWIYDAYAVICFVLSLLSHLNKCYLTQINLFISFNCVKRKIFWLELLFPLFILAVHIYWILFTSVNKLLLFWVMRHKVQCKQYSILSRHKWSNIKVNFKRYTRSCNLNWFFIVYFTQTTILFVFCWYYLIVDMILWKWDSMNDDKLVSFHHKKCMKFKVIL